MARNTLHYHVIKDLSAVNLVAEVRRQFIELSEYIDDTLPEGRSKSLCQTHLEDASMRAIQALAVEYGERQDAGV